MKKFFSIFLSFILVLFSSFCPAKSYACETANVELTKTSSIASSPSFNGIKNIINHPFKILLKGGFWAFLGSIVGCFTVGSGIGSTIGAVAGLASKAIELYEEGCNA